MLRYVIIGFGLFLSGCASITATPLNPDGMAAAPGAATGFRYFLPRPYLLVMAIPAPAANASGAANVVTLPAPQGFNKPPGAAPAPAPTPTNKGNSTDTSTQPAPQTTSTLSSDSDTSYSASSLTYVAKIVYLPDYSHPMAVDMKTGLFGTASMQLTLQAGWMLTNVSANSDNSKMADVLTAALQAIAGVTSGGASKVAATAATVAKQPPGGAPGAPTVTPVLAPGLYAFNYSYGVGRISSLCALAYFDSNGTHPTGPNDVGACGPDISRPSFSNVTSLPAVSQ